MIEVESTIRKWGRSFGVVIPKDKIKSEDIKVDEKVKIIIMKKENPLKETFGTLKFKKSTEQMMKEMDKELYNE